MKRIVIILTALVLLATGCKQRPNFTLTSDLVESRFDSKTDSLFLQSEALPGPAVVHVKDGSFSYSGRVEEPAIATLRGGGIMNATQHFILEKGTITFKNGIPCGTPLNDAVRELTISLRKLAADRFGDKKANAAEAARLVREYLAAHGDDPSAIIALLSARRLVSPDTMAELIALTSKDIQNDGNIRSITKQISRAKRKSAAQPE